jgi:hypothetical protein
MASESQKKRGYELPETITGHQLICVTLKVPDDPHYIAALKDHLYKLGRYYAWEMSYKPGDRRARDAGNYWRQLLVEHLEFGNCNPEWSGCVEFAPDAAIIEWLPNDPYKSPDYRPPEYIAPPWYVQPQFPPSLVGASPGDVVTDISRIPIVPNFGDASSLPRFRITLKGSGQVELHFVNILQGGLAQIQVNGDLLQLTYIELNRDQVSVPPENTGTIIYEITLDGPGEHFIDVTMVPRINDEGIPLSFGGGLRKVVLCGFNQPCPECPDPVDPDCDDCMDCGESQNCDDCEECL